MIQLFYSPTSRRQASKDARELAQAAYTCIMVKAAPKLEKAPSGKPFFPGDALYVSITHTDTMALCALSDHPVGVDAEQLRQVSPRLMQRCLAQEELECCRSSAQPERLFLRFWTLKEAYAKYTGEGIWGFPNDLCFTLEKTQARLQGQPLWFETFEIGDLIVSVCSAAPQQVQIMSDFCAGQREKNKP